MKFLQSILCFKDEVECADVILEAPVEIQKQQWSALYLTGMELTLSELRNILENILNFNDSGLFEKTLAMDNKISVLNAFNPGYFTEENISGVVVLINATSFSEYADKLLQELRQVISLIIKHNPGVSIGESPNHSFSSNELESWFKAQRDRYFFIE